MRADQHVRVIPERAVGGERLAGDDVEGGEADPAGLEGVQQRRLVDDGAAADVDQDRPGPHGAEHLLADEADGGVGAGQGHDDRVDVGGRARELLDRDELVDALDGGAGAGGAQHGRADGVEQRRAGLPDAAEADDEHAHRVELAHLPTRGPVVIALLGEEAGKGLRAGEHAEQGELRQRAAVGAGAGRDGDALELLWREARGAQLGAAAGGHGHHPAQARVGARRAGKLGGIDVGEGEEDVGAVDHLLEAALLLSGALVGGVAVPVGREAAGAVELVVADHLDARLGLLDAGAELLGEVHADHDAGAGGIGGGGLCGGGRHRRSFARTGRSAVTAGRAYPRFRGVNSVHSNGLP